MKLGINGWRIHGRRVGIGRYLLNVVKHWTADTVAGRFDEINFYTPRPIDRHDVSLPNNICECVLRPDARMLVWENVRLGPFTSDDVLFCPSYTRPVFTRCKTVVTTHEATLHLYPKFYPFTARVFHDRLYGWSARRATLVITDTEAAADDIVRAYGVSRSRIRAIPLAAAEIFRPLPGDARVHEAHVRYLGSPAPFFLYVGKLTARRNIPKLMEAFAELKRRTKVAHKLLLIGLNTRKLDLPTLAGRLGITAELVHLEYISDEDLCLLYNAAQAFLMPYTYEAVSLPVMEAQATGTPVITTDTPGLRETTGGAALLLPDAEVSTLLNGMVRLATEEGLRRELAEQGLENSRRFSWQRCSAETLDILEEATRVGLPSPSLCTSARQTP